MAHRSLGLCLVGVWLLGFPAPAHAYIDPGTGSIILQSIIGGIAAGALVIKLYWAKLKARIFPRTMEREREAGSAAKDIGERS